MENKTKSKEIVRIKKVLIFISSYFPNSNANVVCAQLYIDELKRHGYVIDLVTCGNVEKDGVREEKNDISIYRFKNWYVSKIKKINQSIVALSNQKRIKSRLSILALMIEKMFLHIYDLKNAVLVDLNLDRNAILRLVEESEEKYSMMIAFTESFSMPWLASWIKSKLNYNIPLVVCEFDPFTRNSAKSPFFLLRRKYVEKKVLLNADKVLIPPELCAEYEKDFPEFKEKTVTQYFPNLKELNTSCRIHDLDKIICSYAGTLNKSFRSPIALYEIISKIDMENMEVHIYGGGCEEETAQYASLLCTKLVYHGRKETSEVFKAQSEADILINLGNSMGNMTPSKIFELIAFGKPIIHFYRTDNDTCRKYLEKYPCVLFVDERKNYEESAVAVKEFILQNKGKRFSYNEATENLRELRSDMVCTKFVTEIEELL